MYSRNTSVWGPTCPSLETRSMRSDTVYLRAARTRTTARLPLAMRITVSITPASYYAIQPPDRRSAARRRHHGPERRYGRRRRRGGGRAAEPRLHGGRQRVAVGRGGAH